MSRQRRRVGRDVATVAGSSRECGTGSDREGIDGTSPSGVETLARTLADAGVAVLDCEHRTPERAATGKPYIACQITPTRRSLGSPPDAAARASDPLEWQRHIRSKGHREALANRFRDPDDPLKVVIVRDMWLTGFNAPALHTMYVDKPMQGHTLMQAIARVNRKFRDKPGGLVVDYIGLADSLREAVETYTRSGGTGRTADDMARAEEALRMHFEVCESLFHGFDYSRWTTRLYDVLAPPRPDIADLAVSGEAGRHDRGVRAEPHRGAHRHRRAAAEGARLVRGGPRLRRETSATRRRAPACRSASGRRAAPRRRRTRPCRRG